MLAALRWWGCCCSTLWRGRLTPSLEAEGPTRFGVPSACNFQYTICALGRICRQAAMQLQGPKGACCAGTITAGKQTNGIPGQDMQQA